MSKKFLCENVIKGMVEEATRGLAGEDSTLQMLPTFVNDLPTGEEKGVWVVCIYIYNIHMRITCHLTSVDM